MSCARTEDGAFRRELRQRPASPQNVELCGESSTAQRKDRKRVGLLAPRKRERMDDTVRAVAPRAAGRFRRTKGFTLGPDLFGVGNRVVRAASHVADVVRI